MTQREISREISGRANAASPGLFRASVGLAAVVATGLILGLMLGALVAVGSAASFPVWQAGARSMTPPGVRPETRLDRRDITVPRPGTGQGQASAPSS